jgi:molybdopterin/thiamine biosynthesis adenylyltransferase
LNPDTTVRAHSQRLDAETALTLLAEYDLVLDASDNFPTRYLINDACALLKKPLVFGSVSRFEGQVAVFHWGARPVNYRDLFPAPGQEPACAEAGVLGVLTGIIGCLQAMEALKIITGVGEPLAGRLLIYQALTQRFYEVDIE